MAKSRVGGFKVEKDRVTFYPDVKTPAYQSVTWCASVVFHDAGSERLFLKIFEEKLLQINISILLLTTNF